LIHKIYEDEVITIGGKFVFINLQAIDGKSDDEIRELVKLLHSKRIELAIFQGGAV
jgi:hypothetical protein